MPKLSHVRQQLKARAQAPRVAKQQESEAQSLADARKAAEDALIARIRDAVGFRETDLSPVIQAVSSLHIPEPLPVDLSIVIDRVTTAFDALERQLLAQAKATRQAIPKAPKVPETDLSPVLADLQWLKTVLALRPEPPVPKTSWTFTVERDRQGFISQIKAE